MNDSSILYDTQDRVAVIRFNRPQTLNALTGEMLQALVLRSSVRPRTLRWQ